MNRTPANKAGFFRALFLSLCLSLPNSALALRVQNGGLEEQTKTVQELTRALRGNNPEETLASELERPKQPILQEEERERILREVWEEVVERGWLYHGTSLNNLESIRIWGLDVDHKPFDTQEVDTFFRLHKKYFNLQDPYKSTRQNEIISLSYNRSLAEVFSAKPPEVIDILLRESERMIVETNPGSPSNRISDSERQWLIGLHAKYAAWAETHQPLVVAIPLKEGIERALFYRKPGDLLSNYRMSAETLYRTDPLFALLDFDAFKVMAKTRFRKFERTGFEKTALARQLQSDLRDILHDVEVSRVGGPYSGSRLSVSPSPDVFVPISEYAPASAGLEEVREAAVQKIWDQVHRLGTLDEIRSMPLEAFARKVGVKVIDRAGIGRPIFTLSEEFYKNLVFLRQNGRLPSGVAATSYAPLVDNTAIDGPGIYLATKDLEALRQAIRQAGELMEYNKGTFIHELLEEAFAQAGVVDPVLHLFRQHTDPAVIEEEMLFNGLMGPQDVRQAAEIYRGMKEGVEDILLSRPEDYFPTIQKKYRALRGDISSDQIAQALGNQSPYYRTLGWAFETPPDRLEELAKQRWQGASFKSFVQSGGLEENGEEYTPIGDVSSDVFWALKFGEVREIHVRTPDGIIRLEPGVGYTQLGIGDLIEAATRDQKREEWSRRVTVERYGNGNTAVWVIGEHLELAFGESRQDVEAASGLIMETLKRKTMGETPEAKVLLRLPNEIRELHEAIPSLIKSLVARIAQQGSDALVRIERYGPLLIVRPTSVPEAKQEQADPEGENVSSSRWGWLKRLLGLQSSGLEETGATLERARVRVPNLVTQQQDTVRLLRESSDQITDAAEYLPGLYVELQEAGYREGKMLLVPGDPLSPAFLDTPLVTVYVHPESEGAATVKELLDSGLGYWLRFETDPTKAQILIGDEAYKDSVASELLARKQSFLVINGNTASSVTVNLLGRLQAEGYLTAGRVFYLYTDLEDVTALFA